MRVLVTGGTGFVGSHLIEALVARDQEVVCLVRPTSDLRWIASLPVQKACGTLEDADSLSRALEGVEVVFHLAGVTKALSPGDYDRFNHRGTRTLLEACARHGRGLRRFVYVSSLAAAGPSPTRLPRRESDPPAPVSLYGRSKLRGEEAVLTYQSAFSVTILRPPAVFGPRDTDLLELMKMVRRGIFATFGGGERLIDLCYVGDVVAAILLAAERPQAAGEVFFVGSGVAYEWEEAARLVAARMGKHLRVITLPAAGAAVYALLCDLKARLTGKPNIISRHKLPELRERYWICDIAKARELLHYTPSFALERGLDLTLKWYRDRGWL